MAMVIMNFLGNILFKICTNKERVDDEKKRYICFSDDIVMEILLRLPVKVLLPCKCLSKHWFQLISSSYFRRLQHEWAKTHQNRILYKTESDAVGLCLSSLDINNNCNNTTTASYSFSSVLPQREFHILGSCDGLVCLFDYKSVMVLCNPTTKECVQVPLNIEQVPAGYNRWFDFKFGYDPVTDKYKVVRLDIYFSTTDLGYTEVYVYTLGSKVWRKIIPTVFRLANSHYASYVHGAFHWFKLTDDSTWNDQGIIGIDDSSIISFDVGSEEFGTIPWINNNMAKSGDTTNKVVLGVLQECLSVSHKYNEEEGSYYIWLMKDYGVKESWTKVFSFSFKGSSLYNCVPIIVMENGVIIQHGETGKLNEKGNLYTYNIQKQTISKGIPIVAWRTACIFVESLVSISSIGTQVDGNMG